MTHIIRTIATISMIAITAPAVAGGISFDLPRLDFPQPSPDATRACLEITHCAAPAR